MKSAGLFEDALLDSGEIMKRAVRGAIYNMGKIIAIFTLLITVAVTFTDISFSYELTEELISSVLLLLTSSYIIYFSLVDAGEKYGMESEEYRRAAKDYGNIRAQIRGDMIEAGTYIIATLVCGGLMIICLVMYALDFIGILREEEKKDRA